MLKRLIGLSSIAAGLLLGGLVVGILLGYACATIIFVLVNTR